MRLLTPVTASFVLAFSSNALAAPPPAYAHHVCPDGLEVLVAERHAAPLITIEIGVHNGSMAESPEYNGLSHLYEHMFFKGNKVLPDQSAYLDRARELGLLWNGTTDTERVNYFFSTTSDHYADAMAFMHDAIVSPLFDAKELNQERVVVTGEIDRNESDPNYYFWHESTRHLFGKYLSRKDPLGDRKTVLTATTEKLHTIQHRYYVPNNSILVVTGDVKADDVFKQADEMYKDWAKADDPFVKYPLVKFQPLAKSEVLLITQPVTTFTGEFAYFGPSTKGDSVGMTYAADLMGALTRSPASKFQKDLVDSGLCVRAGLNWSTQRNVGPITLDFEATDKNVDGCVKAIQAELPKITQADYFTDEEMHNAALTTDVGLAKERETSSGYAHQITFAWAFSDLDYYKGYVDHLYAVTRADLSKYVATYITDKPYVFTAMESPDLAKTMDAKHLGSLVGVTKLTTVAPHFTEMKKATKAKAGK